MRISERAAQHYDIDELDITYPTEDETIYRVNHAETTRCPECGFRVLKVCPACGACVDCHDVVIKADRCPEWVCRYAGEYDHMGHWARRE